MFMIIENDDDRDFIAELYHRDSGLWYSRAMNIVHDDFTARDMINDSFVKLFDKIQLLRSFNCYKARAYVVITIENTCKTFLSQSTRKTQNVDFFDDVAEKLSTNNTPEEKILYDADIETLKKVILTLEPKEQDFLTKCYYEKINDKEIAQQTGMVYNNIRMYRSRLLRKIRKLYAKESEVKIHE